jgi:proline iminopeptidase
MICGEYDEAVPKSCHKFSDMIHKSRIIIVPNVGHATMSENEAFYLMAVKKYLSEMIR